MHVTRLGLPGAEGEGRHAHSTKPQWYKTVCMPGSDRAWGNTRIQQLARLAKAAVVHVHPSLHAATACWLVSANADCKPQQLTSQHPHAPTHTHSLLKAVMVCPCASLHGAKHIGRHLPTCTALGSGILSPPSLTSLQQDLQVPRAKLYAVV